jgi:hypothetical protein
MAAKTESLVGVKPALDRLRLQAWRFRDALQHRVRGRAHRRHIFQRIYDQNLWGDPESASGGGSGTAATDVIRRELPALLSQYGIRSLLDAPCGDFHWMRYVVGTLDCYVGVDIVRDLVDRNTRLFGSERIHFACSDIVVDPLPSADAVLCRDCFIHLPTRLIRAALANFRASGIRYLLLTNDRDVETYHDIPIGSFRRINFERAPFSFPPPLAVLNENPNGDRQLCLWELESLFPRRPIAHE